MTQPPTRFQDAINRLTSGPTRFELVYTSRPSWAQSRISVLDSSFNPPTLAHSALASASLSSSSSMLLLFSISNAEKTPKPGDATPVQKLEMMVSLADELASKDQRGVAVAALNEPMFVKKSTLLLENLSNKDTELIFQMGWDTIIRVFSPKYYPSPDSMLASFTHFFGPERSTILCARRPSAPAPSSSSPASTTIPADSLTDEESEFLSSPYVAPFYKEQKIKLVDLDPVVRGISSSGVRGGTIEDAERWCSEGIVNYIREHRLYFWD